MNELQAPGKSISVLGVPVTVVNMESAVSKLMSWVQTDSLPPRKVFVREVASLMLALNDNALLRDHFDADMIVPDGMPLVLIGKLKGHGSSIGRIAGADLVDSICAATADTGKAHYFYGGKPGVAIKMADQLVKKYPGLKVAGCYCPPLRHIDSGSTFDDAMREEVEKIKAAKPDFIWIGISSPKQEFWMTEAAPLIGYGVFVGVGAAFDFISGEVTRAPKFMRSTGLEWLFRLVSEPKRLWRRYLILAPKFVILLFLDLFKPTHDKKAPPQGH